MTPYGREWRGHFQHLPAWTPPYAVEFGCLLSLVNEKSDLLFFCLRFLTCFLLGGQQRHTFSPTPLVLPSAYQSNVEVLISKPLLGFNVRGLHEILHWQFCFRIRRAEGDCSLVSFLIIPGSSSIKAVEFKTSILCFGWGGCWAEKM